jgi:hypothetical protein
MYGACVGESEVGEEVGLSVVGKWVGTCVGEYVVGAGVGECVVGACVGACVGARDVGAIVGSGVGASVGWAHRQMCSPRGIPQPSLDCGAPLMHFPFCLGVHSLSHIMP